MSEGSSVLYVDTSALGRVLLEEAGGGGAVSRTLMSWTCTSSRLLRIELLRLGLRRQRLRDAEGLLETIALVPLDEPTLRLAETLPPAAVATLDAIHLATAVRLAEAGLLATVLTYDHWLAEGCRVHGLEVLAPA